MAISFGSGAFLPKPMKMFTPSEIDPEKEDKMKTAKQLIEKVASGVDPKVAISKFFEDEDVGEVSNQADKSVLTPGLDVEDPKTVGVPEVGEKEVGPDGNPTDDKSKKAPSMYGAGEEIPSEFDSDTDFMQEELALRRRVRKSLEQISSRQDESESLDEDRLREQRRMRIRRRLEAIRRRRDEEEGIDSGAGTEGTEEVAEEDGTTITPLGADSPNDPAAAPVGELEPPEDEVPSQPPAEVPMAENALRREHRLIDNRVRTTGPRSETVHESFGRAFRAFTEEDEAPADDEKGDGEFPFGDEEDAEEVDAAAIVGDDDDKVEFEPEDGGGEDDEEDKNEDLIDDASDNIIQKFEGRSRFARFRRESRMRRARRMRESVWDTRYQTGQKVQFNGSSEEIPNGSVGRVMEQVNSAGDPRYLVQFKGLRNVSLVKHNEISLA